MKKQIWTVHTEACSFQSPFLDSESADSKVWAGRVQTVCDDYGKNASLISGTARTDKSFLTPAAIPKQWLFWRRYLIYSYHEK